MKMKDDSSSSSEEEDEDESDSDSVNSIRRPNDRGSNGGQSQANGNGNGQRDGHGNFIGRLSLIKLSSLRCLRLILFFRYYEQSASIFVISLHMRLYMCVCVSLCVLSDFN